MGAGIGFPAGSIRSDVGDIVLRTKSNNYTYFKDNGNVGIGTTTPTAKLYVNGTSIFNDLATFTQPVIVGTPVLSSHAATKSQC